MTAPAPRPGPDVAERLAEAVPFTTVMRFHGPAEVPSRAEREHIAAALLPVVDAIAAERTAEIEAMAERAQRHGYDLDPDDVLDAIRAAIAGPVAQTGEGR